MLLTTLLASATPTINIKPEKLKPKDTVTFTVTIPENNDIIEVVIIVEECESGLCFVDKFNETMIQKSNDTYETTITLRHNTAVEIKYRVGYLTSAGWIWYPADADNLISKTLDTSTSNTDNNQSSNGTPGYEFIVFAFAIIFISLILHRQKR